MQVIFDDLSFLRNLVNIPDNGINHYNSVMRSLSFFHNDGTSISKRDITNMDIDNIINNHTALIGDNWSNISKDEFINSDRFITDDCYENCGTFQEYEVFSLYDRDAFVFKNNELFVCVKVFCI